MIIIIFNTKRNIVELTKRYTKLFDRTFRKCKIFVFGTIVVIKFNKFLLLQIDFCCWVFGLSFIYTRIGGQGGGNFL